MPFDPEEFVRKRTEDPTVGQLAQAVRDNPTERTVQLALRDALLEQGVKPRTATRVVNHVVHQGTSRYSSKQAPRWVTVRQLQELYATRTQLKRSTSRRMGMRLFSFEKNRQRLS